MPDLHPRQSSSDQADHLDSVVVLAIEQGALLLPVRVGQVYARVAMLMRNGSRFRETGRRDHTRIRITGVPAGRATMYRYVKVDPKPMGNGRPDRGEHRITMMTLARHYALADDAGR